MSDECPAEVSVLQVVLCSLGELQQAIMSSSFQGTQWKNPIISDDYDFNNSVSHIHRHMTPVVNKTNYLVLVQLDVYY